MTLTNSMPWLRRAQIEKFAVGAFNANSLEQMQAIVLAAQAERAPVIIQISHNAAVYMGAGNRLAGLRLVAAMGKAVADMVDVPVVLHLDHGGELDLIQVIGLGFTSVMFDGSHLPYEQNIAMTRRLCEIAHEAGAAFEAELGEVPRSGGDPAEEEGKLTDPAQVAEFVSRTGVDALAVAVGSVHALQQKEIELDLMLLDAIHAAVDIPLVLHGSSGVVDSSITAGIQRGLTKINVATQLNSSFTGTVRRYLTTHPNVVDPRKYLDPARASMVEQVRERIHLFGASGKAAE